LGAAISTSAACSKGQSERRCRTARGNWLPCVRRDLPMVRTTTCDGAKPTDHGEANGLALRGDSKIAKCSLDHFSDLLSVSGAEPYKPLLESKAGGVGQDSARSIESPFVGRDLRAEVRPAVCGRGGDALKVPDHGSECILEG
jgi:hypothetical protein